MKTKRSTLFWLSVIAIGLLFITLSFYTKNSNKTTLKIISIISESHEELFSFINQLFVPLYRRRLTCDPAIWKSPLIEKYGVAITLTVDQKGCGKFNSLQKAVDAVPENAAKPTLIILDAGIYKEKVNVKISKSNLIIQGQGYLNTIITWDDTAAKSNGTFYSYSVGVFAPKFIAQDISFKNTAPMPKQGSEGGQAVAFRIAGDQAAFYNCGFYGFQDTLLDDTGRHYFKNCFIQGTIDFIFGNGRSLYENCEIHSVASHGVGIYGSIAAQQRASLQEKTGFSFVNCKITGSGNISLGRAWGVYSTVVYIKTYMAGIIAPQGWDDWKDHFKYQKVFFGEYNCSGPGSSTTSRVKYAKKLNVTEAAPFMNIAYIDGKDWIKNT